MPVAIIALSVGPCVGRIAAVVFSSGTGAHRRLVTCGHVTFLVMAAYFGFKKLPNELEDFLYKWRRASVDVCTCVESARSQSPISLSGPWQLHALDAA